MSKEEIIKLIESLKMEEITSINIEYYTEKHSGKGIDNRKKKNLNWEC